MTAFASASIRLTSSANTRRSPAAAPSASRWACARASRGLGVQTSCAARASASPAVLEPSRMAANSSSRGSDAAARAICATRASASADARPASARASTSASTAGRARSIASARAPASAAEARAASDAARASASRAPSSWSAAVAVSPAATRAFAAGEGRVEPLVAEHALEHLVAVPVGRLQELREPVLGEQHRSAERREVHPQELHDPFAGRLLELDRLQDVGAGRVLRQPLELVPALAPPARGRAGRARSGPRPRRPARLGAKSASWWISERVSRSNDGVLPKSANATPSRIEDLPAPIGPTIPTSRRSRKSNVVRSR